MLLEVRLSPTECRSAIRYHDPTFRLVSRWPCCSRLIICMFLLQPELHSLQQKKHHDVLRGKGLMSSLQGCIHTKSFSISCSRTKKRRGGAEVMSRFLASLCHQAVGTAERNSNSVEAER
jgi:hypothetical protein